jgi:hypothetical protein
MKYPPLIFSLLITAFIFMASYSGDKKNKSNSTPAYLDPDKAVEERVDDLISRMTLEEKTGDVDETGIVQLYIRNDVSHVTRPVKELKDYKRVDLKAGETKKITFTLPVQKLAYYDESLNYLAEPGTFTIMAGSSSLDKDLLKSKVLIK